MRDEALHHGRRITDNGKGIDDHQVQTERLAYLATEVEAARALSAYAAGRVVAAMRDPITVAPVVGSRGG
jgi:alkylation response protein AidB-like acyl-CoA dehydrogenase